MIFWSWPFQWELKWMNNFLLRNYAKLLYSLKKVLGSPECGNFIHFFNAILVSFQVFYFANVPWMFKNTKDNFPLLIVLVRRERSHCVLVTFPFIREYGPFNSMRIRNFRGHLQTTRMFKYSHSTLYCIRTSLCSTSIIWRILPTSCFNYFRRNLGSILGCQPSH